MRWRMEEWINWQSWVLNWQSGFRNWQSWVYWNPLSGEHRFNWGAALAKEDWAPSNTHKCKSQYPQVLGNTKVNTHNYPWVVLVEYSHYLTCTQGCPYALKIMQELPSNQKYPQDRSVCSVFSSDRMKKQKVIFIGAHFWCPQLEIAIWFERIGVWCQRVWELGRGGCQDFMQIV